MFPAFILTIEDDDQRSFMEQLYLDHRSSMYHTAIGVLRNPADAEDAVQTVFLTLCEKVPQLMEMSCYVLRSYIVISTRNAAIDVIRKRKRKPELLWGEEDYLDSLLDGQSEEESALLSIIEQEALNKAMMRLTLRDRSMLEMKYILMKSDNEIGAAFGVKTNSVRPLLARIKNRLQKILKEEHEN
jgi:RNA polymerase sigma-70 factor (ECF subfamily)